MRKPSPKGSSKTGIGIDPVKVAEQAFDLGKEIVSGVTEYGMERERTKQKKIEADADVAKEREKTIQTAIGGRVDIERIRSENEMHGRESDGRTIDKLAAKDRLESISRQEEKVLDQVLQNEKDQLQLAQHYRTLINNRDR